MDKEEAREAPPNKRELALWKKLAFSLLPLLVLLVVGEFALRMAHYQFTSKHSFAISHAIDFVQTKIRQRKASAFVDSFGVSAEEANEALYTREVGKKLLRQLQDNYVEYFQSLVREAQDSQVKLAVLFIPTSSDKGGEVTHSFFKGLAEKNSLRFIDLTDEFKKYPAEQIFLIPENGHPSRFGYSIIADVVEDYLKEVHAHRSPKIFTKRPEVFGDLRPNINEVMDEHSVLVYRMITNRQGVRMSHDLEFPKKKQRILFLGDSFTFGSYVPNEHTFVGELAKRIPDKEMVNAGKWGFTIVDESTLFAERAKFMEPDVVVIQVLENDIYGMLSTKLGAFSRLKQDFSPSDEEVAFFEALKEQKPVSKN